MGGLNSSSSESINDIVQLDADSRTATELEEPEDGTKVYNPASKLQNIPEVEEILEASEERKSEVLESKAGDLSQKGSPSRHSDGSHKASDPYL